MKRIFIAIAMLFVMDADTMAVNMNGTFGNNDISSLRSSTPPPQPIEYAIPYIPHQNVPLDYHHIEDLHNESVIYLKLRRWIFQPISIVFQITAGGLFVGSQCCMDKYPESAKILNGIGLGVSMVSFVANILLLKIDNKLGDIDRYVVERRDFVQNIPQAQPNEIYPAIIQR